MALWVTAPRRKRIYSLIQLCWAPVKHHSNRQLSNPSLFFSISSHTNTLLLHNSAHTHTQRLSPHDVMVVDSWDICRECCGDLSLRIRSHFSARYCFSPELLYRRGESFSCTGLKPPCSPKLWHSPSEIFKKTCSDSERKYNAERERERSKYIL